MKYYAGIGSRETPLNVCYAMQKIAEKLSNQSYCLRSGGAPGADTAFECGAQHKEIFLPWNGFNNKWVDGKQYIVPPLNKKYVKQFHPSPSKLKEGGILLMSRNTYQVLGQNLNDPVSFLLCWTKDGSATGGTGQAIRIANHFNIPVFNIKNGYEDFANFMTMSILCD